MTSAIPAASEAAIPACDCTTLCGSDPDIDKGLCTPCAHYAASRKRLALTETLEWKDVNDSMPDSDETVLVFHEDAPDPVWLAYYDGTRWVSVDGMPLEDAVTHWAQMPGGPQK